MLSKLIDVINSKARRKLEIVEGYNYDILKARAVEISMPKYKEWKMKNTAHSIMSYFGEMPIGCMNPILFPFEIRNSSSIKIKYITYEYTIE